MQVEVPSVFGALHPAQTSVCVWTPQSSLSVQGLAQLPLLNGTVPGGQPRFAHWVVGVQPGSVLMFVPVLVSVFVLVLVLSMALVFVAVPSWCYHRPRRCWWWCFCSCSCSWLS
jgi:hypothetical protein